MNKILPIWTGEVMGTMHIYGITREMLAARIGIDKAYLSALLHAKRRTAKAEEKIRTALMEMVDEKINASEMDY